MSGTNMCGIAGFFFDKQVPYAQILPALNKMSLALHHRGPDGRGWVVFSDQGVITDQIVPEKVANAHVYGGCLHTRLAITDLSDRAHQPMSCPLGRYWIVYNGEVYNFREIRNTLESCGWTFRSESDTEVVLYAYLQWGPSALEKFNGMFAFAVFDRQTKTLFCARDRIGIKPFYYVLKDGIFLFASDATTLIASGFYVPEVNWEGVVHGISFQGAPRPMTVYKDVYALTPGHYRIGMVPRLQQETCYWHLPVGQPLLLNEHEALEQFEDLLKRAVKRCLITDVEVATLMSGGVDSTTLTAIAAQQRPNIRAFTLAFDDALRLESELPQALAIARRYSLQHHITVVSREDMALSLDDMVWTSEEPLGSLEPHDPIARSIASHGIKVVLNGLGPDELLGGYQYYRMLSHYWPLLKPFAFLAPFLPPIGRWPKVAKLMQAIDPWDIYHRFFANSLWEKPHTLFNDELRFDSYAWMRHYLGDLTVFQDPIQALSYADIKLYIGTHHNHACDRFLMRSQIEGRFPYLDHELVEFCYRLPADLKCRTLKGKDLLRRLSAKYIDPSCLSMKKKGFNIPERSFFNEAIKDTLIQRVAALDKRGLFKRSVMTQVTGDHDRDPRNAKRLLYLANFELWYQWFIEKKHPLFCGSQ